MANIARLTELLEKVIPGIPPQKFDMAEILHPCGSPSCLGGFADVHPPFRRQGIAGETWECFFDLDGDEWAHLFRGDHPNDLAQAACRVIDVIEANT